MRGRAAGAPYPDDFPMRAILLQSRDEGDYGCIRKPVTRQNHDISYGFPRPYFSR